MTTSARKSGRGGLRCAAILACIVWGGIVAALLTPLILDAVHDYFYPYSSPKGLWFMGAVQTAFAGWVGLACIERKFRPEANIIAFGVLACIVFQSVSAVHGPDAVRSFWSTYERMSGVAMHAHLFVFFLVLASFLKSDGDWRRLFAVSASVAAVVSILGLVHNLGSGSPIPAGYLSSALNCGSTLGNTSFMGSYLLINSFLTLYLFLTSSGRKKMLYAVLIVLLVSGILLNPGGRAMKISLLVGVASIAAMRIAAMDRIRNERKRAVAYAVALILPVFAIFSMLFIYREAVLPGVMGIDGVSIRLEVWSIAWNGFLDRPLLGWGLENFDLVYFKYFDPAILVGQGLKTQVHWFDRAHNGVFDVLVSGGVVGLVSHYFVPLAAIFYLWRSSMRSKVDGIWTAIIFTAMFMAHFIQNLTVFDTVSSRMLMFAAFAFASRTAPPITLPSLHLQNIPSGIPKILVASSAVAISLFAFWNCVHVPGKVSREIGGISSNNPDAPLLERYIYISDSLVVGRHEAKVMMSEIAATRLRNLADAGDGSGLFREADFILSRLEESSDESPKNFRVLYESGQLNSDATVAMSSEDGPNGDDSMALNYAVQAEAAYRKAIIVSPRHVLAHLGLARSLIYQGFILDDVQFHSVALKVAEEAIEIEPALFASHELALDIAHDLLEDDGLSSRTIERAEKIDSRWGPRLLRRIGKR